MNLSTIGFYALISFLNVAAIATAGTDSTNGEGPVNVPAAFLASRLVRPVGTPGTTYRVVVDVPPAASPGAARPKITESSGDDAVDGIAWDYVKQNLRTLPALAAKNVGHELRFPLRIVPAAVSLGNADLPDRYRPMPKEGIFKPAPWYPAGVRARRVSGAGRVKVVFPAAGGHPRLAALLESTGDQSLDKFIVFWVLFTWQSAPQATELVDATTLDFQLR